MSDALLVRGQAAGEHRRRTLDPAGLAWAAAGLLGTAIWPWSRSGRGLLEGGPSALALLAERPALWLVLATLVLAIPACLAGARRARGLALVALGLVGLVASVAELAASGRAFDAGFLVVCLALASLLGLGLAASGLIGADGFVAGAAVWSGLFVVAFIIYPLGTMLRGAFGTDGLTFEHFAEVLSSPAFFLLENPFTPQSETAAALAGAGAGLLAGLGLAVRSRLRGLALVRAGVAGALLGAAVVAVVVGFGALRNSLALSVVVGFTSTALGLAFALLGSRGRLRAAPYLAVPLAGAGAALGSALGAGPLLTAAGAAAGIGLAALMWRARWTASRMLGAFSVLPIITPPFVIGFALIFLLGRQGAITSGLLGLDTDALMGPVGVGIAQTLAFTPIAYLVLVGVVNGLDPALEEAAQTLRASRWQVLRSVVWPLLRPGLANAFLLGMIESLADFGNPFILGGSYLATEVFLAVEFSPANAAVYGAVLLAIALGVFAAQRHWVGATSYVTVTGKPSGGRLSPLPLGLERGLLVVFAAWVGLAAAVYGSIMYGAFVRLWGFDGSFTLDHIRGLQSGSLGIFLSTLRIAAVSAVPATVVGLVIAYLVTRQRFHGRGLLEAGSLLSFAVPGTVMGIGYILAFNTGPLYLTGTATILVLAFVFRNMPVGIRSSVAALRQIDPSLEEASTTLRAPTAVTLWRVVVPLVGPALLTGLVFAFVRAVTAISQVIFLISPDHKLVTTEILGMVERGQLGSAAALSALLVLTLGATVAALFGLSRLLGVRPSAAVQEAA